MSASSRRDSGRADEGFAKSKHGLGLAVEGSSLATYRAGSYTGSLCTYPRREHDCQTIGGQGEMGVLHAMSVGHSGGGGGGHGGGGRGGCS